MAFNNISVNTVYTTVLSILNKEQRGYITPYEFNNLANQVQLEVFESYFENLNQQMRAQENSSEYADRVKLLREKISVFETTDTITVSPAGVGDLTTLTPDLHRLGTVHLQYGSNIPVEVQQVTRHEFNLARRSKIAAPDLTWPIYYLEGTNINVLPANATAVGPPAYTYEVEYIRKPATVQWAYVVGPLGQYIFDGPPNSTDFEISDVDQTEVILKILGYCGVVIRDTEIVQLAAQAAAGQDQLEQV